MSGEAGKYCTRKQKQKDGFSSIDFWTKFFHSMDKNHDGKVSYTELKNKLNELNFSLAKNTARKILKYADSNGDGYLSLNEFLACLQDTVEVRNIFAKALRCYVKVVVPKSKQSFYEYEKEFRHFPYGMCFISILMVVGYYLFDITVNSDHTGGKLGVLFLYDPRHRSQVWRFITYMLVHQGPMHLMGNLLIQIMLGMPLEMVHNWRVMVVYLAGVLAGSLGGSIIKPRSYLVGASAGTYAIITANISSIIMNWQEVRFALNQVTLYLLFIAYNASSTFYSAYVLKQKQTTGHGAHLCGSIAGLLMAIVILRNLKEANWERKLWWIALITYICLMLVAISWHAAFPTYF